MTTPTRKSALALPEGYADWLAQLKGQIVQARQRASLSVNAELVQLYGRIGRDILERQQSEGWGAKVIDRLALDLKDAFADMRGWSVTACCIRRASRAARCTTCREPRPYLLSRFLRRASSPWVPRAPHLRWPPPHLRSPAPHLTTPASHLRRRRSANPGSRALAQRRGRRVMRMGV